MALSLFHIGGELAADWLKQMELETEAHRYDGMLEWFEL